MDYELIKPDAQDKYDPAPFLSYARLRRTDKEERDADVGDIVHYWHDQNGRCRAAVVVDVLDTSFDEPCTVDLLGFQRNGTVGILDVPHVEQKQHHTWHWPCGGQ